MIKHMSVYQSETKAVSTKAIFIAILIVTTITSGPAQKISLKVGDPAPALRVQKWVKGEPVKYFESGKFYLVELSATWCAPCRLFIPHLSEIAKKYKGKLEVISVYTNESNPDKPSDLKYVKKIEEFIHSVDSKIAFSVAIDVPENHFWNNWLQASGQTGIPAAFLIDDKAKVVWLGHPGGVEEILDAAFSGKTIQEAVKKADTERAKNTLDLADLEALKSAGKLSEALEKLDTYFMPYGKTASYYKFKFSLLAGVDDDKAYECLQWILDNVSVHDYDWYHLISSYESVKKPNYAITHQIADRAIEQAETNWLKAHATREKAVVFIREGNFRNGIDLATKALEMAKKETLDANNLEAFTSVVEFGQKLLQKARS